MNSFVCCPKAIRKSRRRSSFGCPSWRKKSGSLPSRQATWTNSYPLLKSTPGLQNWHLKSCTPLYPRSSSMNAVNDTNSIRSSKSTSTLPISVSWEKCRNTKGQAVLMHFLSSDTDKYKGVFIVALKISGFSIFGGDEWNKFLWLSIESLQCIPLIFPLIKAFFENISLSAYVLKIRKVIKIVYKTCKGFAAFCIKNTRKKFFQKCVVLLISVGHTNTVNRGLAVTSPNWGEVMRMEDIILILILILIPA